MPLSDLELADLARRYPYTVTNFLRLANGRATLAHVASLDQRWAALMHGEQPANPVTVGDLPPTAADYDIIVAGGSLGLLTALALTLRGWRVMVFDQRVAGSAHREWNISRDELQALVDGGLFTWTELGTVIMRHYRTGLVHFRAGAAPQHDVWINDVLDVAIDAGALLRLARQRLEDLRVPILDHRAFRQVWLADHGPARCVVELMPVVPGAEAARLPEQSPLKRAETRETDPLAPVMGLRSPSLVASAPGVAKHYGARLLINALGSTSPLSLALLADTQPSALFSGVCPTVGTVARGYASQGPHAVDLDLGEILVTTDHADDGGRRQLMWEGFPGRDDELTVYLFYYDLVDPQRPQSLLDLFEVYFQRLADYKAPGSDFEHLRPVYGFIPSRHGACTCPTVRGVMPIGDAAAQQSPLTFCGFGSHVRNLNRIADLTDYALRHDLLEADDLAQITPHQANVSLMWVFARFMQPWRGGAEVNDIMNRFLAVLDQLGPDVTRRFFQDRTTWRDYTRLLLRFALACPAVLLWAGQVLGWRGVGRWLVDYAAFTRHAALGSLLTILGNTPLNMLKGLVSLVNPKWGLRLRSFAAERNVSTPPSH